MLGLVNALTIPSNIVSYIPITLTNSQTNSISSNFQQQITVNALKYNQYYVSNLINAEFFYVNGTIIPSWLEGNYLNESQKASLSTSSNIVYLLLIGNGNFLRASSTNTLYLGFAGNVVASANILMNGVTTGEAPQLSTNYAVLDNGGSIFPFYDNFKGTVLNTTKWGFSKYGMGNESVDNGITFSAPSNSLDNYNDYYFIYSNAVLTYPKVAEMYLSAASNSIGFVVAPELGVSTTTANDLEPALVSGYAMIWHTSVSVTNHHLEYYACNASNSTGGCSYLLPGFGYIKTPLYFGTWSVTWAATGVEHFSDGNNTNSTTDNSLAIANYHMYLGDSALEGGYNGTVTVQWAGDRLYPPNGIMPAASFGSVNSALVATLTPSNSILDSGQTETYTVGISSGTGPYTVNIFNITSGKTQALFGYQEWQRTTSYPLNTSGTACILYKNTNLYCIGGISGADSSNLVTTNAVYSTTLNSNLGLGSWTQLSNYPVNSYSSCILSTNTIYCVDGYDYPGVVVNTTHYSVISPSNTLGPWISATNYPFPGGLETCVTDYGYVYCIGGLNNTAGESVNSVYSAHILPGGGLGSWIQQTSYPLDAYQDRCVVYSPTNNVYCMGDGSPISTNTYYASLLSNGGVSSWTQLNSRSGPEYDAPCVITGNYIYCVAGATQNSPYFSSNTYYTEILPGNTISAWTQTTSYPDGVDSEGCFTNNQTLFPVLYCIAGDGIGTDFNRTGADFYAPLNALGEANTLRYSFVANSAVEDNAFKYNVTVTDSEATPVTASSAVNMIIVDTAPTATLTVSNSIGVNSLENLTVLINGGAGPFDIKYFNETVAMALIGNGIAASPGSSNTFAFTVGLIGNFMYNAIANDIGTTTPFEFSTSTQSINVESTTSTTSVTTTTTVPTTTASGGSGGGGSGGGGVHRPTIIPEANGYIVSSIAQLDTWNITMCGVRLYGTENYISPDAGGITFNGDPYALSFNASFPIEGTTTCYVRLLNVSYLPLEQTITIDVYTTSSPITKIINVTNQSISTIQNVSSLENLKINMLRLQSSVFFSYYLITLQTITAYIDNATSRTPPPPQGYSKIIAMAINMTNADNITTNAIFSYDCKLNSSKIALFVLENGSWAGINNYTLNGNSCEVSFVSVADPTFALMTSQFETSGNTTTSITTISTTLTTATSIQTSTITQSEQKGQQEKTIIIIVGVIILIGIIIGYYLHISRGMHRNNA